MSCCFAKKQEEIMCAVSSASFYPCVSLQNALKYTTGCINWRAEMRDLAFQIERDILKVGNQLNNMRDEDLKQRNITPAQSETLLFFAEHEGATVSELKDYLKISHQAARKLAEKLREKKIPVSMFWKDLRQELTHRRALQHW